MSSPHPGILSTADQTLPDATYLPLESLNAHVYIADVSARVVLSQLYFNEARDALKEAHYVFPVPARAAVCSFEMRTDDGRRLKGVVKEITQAKAEYEEAVSQGKLAGLLQQFGHDVFAVCIGTIPPRGCVTVSLSYVVDLAENDQHNTVRFQLQSYVGARYGAPPTSTLYRGTAHKSRVSITAEVEMASSIISVWSPTHAIELITRNTAQHIHPIPVNHYACVQWVSTDTFLDTDFLLVVQASGLDRPRCLAETLSPSAHSSSFGNGGSTTALALTIVPRFDLPTLRRQEYIFLIDRSGSMDGQGIETAKKALGFLLRMLPSGSATVFNVFSFGSYCTSTWPQSQDYNNFNLEYATREIDDMEANMGGTEILAALAKIFSTRSHGIPTSVFVLTDGEVYHPEEVINYVRQTVLSAPGLAPLRLFTLGVGHGASTRLCQGIADAGNGFCSMALETEDLMLKSVRLVDAMRVSKVEGLTVDWEVPDQALQAPDPILSISPGVRSVVTAIVSNNAPTQVTLKGRRSDGSFLEYRVPVLEILPNFPSIYLEDSRRDLEIPPLLHTLAAHRYIQGLDGGGMQPHGGRFGGLSPRTRGELIKNLIVELGTQYQVASSYTAFVAVDAPNPRRLSDAPGNPPKRDPITNANSPEPGQNHINGMNSRYEDSLLDAGIAPTASGRTEHGSKEETDKQTSPSGARSASRKTSPTSSRSAGGPDTEQALDFYVCDPPDGTAVDEVLVLPDPLGGNNPIICIAPPLSQTSIFPLFSGRSFWSLLFRPLEASRRLATLGVSAWQTFQQTVWSKDFISTKSLLDFSRLQAAEGSFSLTWELSSAVGIPAERLRSSIPPVLSSISSGGKVWATAIAVAFFRSRYDRHREIWQTLQDKAYEFGSASFAGGSGAFDHIVEEALKLFSS